MISYAEFMEKATVEITEQEFNKIEPRSVSLLASLCSNSDKWSETCEICKMALIYQIEYIVSTGGVENWVKGTEGKVASRSYSIGGESESVSYTQSASEKEGTIAYHGLLIAPLAWNVLMFNGIIRTIRSKRVW